MTTPAASTTTAMATASIAPSVTAPSATASADADAAPAPSSPSSAPAAASATASRSKIEGELARAIAAQKKHLVEKCWAPSAKESPEPARAKYTVVITFDGQGKQITRSILESRSTPRAGIIQCMQREMTTVTVSAPGATTEVESPLELP